MQINKTLNGTEMTIALEGRLDTITSPQLEKELNQDLADVTKLVFDLSDLAYISSAGLRVLLSAQKVMMKRDGMIIRGASDDLMEIFEVTGFVDILTIE